MFTVESVDDTVDSLRANGAELVGEVAQYEGKYRLCYMRGPAGMRVFLTLQVTTAQDAHVMQFVSGNDVSQRANADIILVCLSVSQPLRFI